MKYAEYEDEALYRATQDNMIDYAVEYGEFEYQAGSWDHYLRSMIIPGEVLKAA